MLSRPASLLAWSSADTNKISIADLNTKETYATFDGVQNKNTNGVGFTHVKSIPNTKLLFSLQYASDQSANLELFDISRKGRVHKVYSYEEACRVAGGDGDVTYNPRRNLLGAIPLEGKAAYHLFGANLDAKTDKIMRLFRKSKWLSQYGDTPNNRIAGLEFDPNGTSMATLSRYGICLISAVDTGCLSSHLKLNMKTVGDGYGRCRWSPNFEEPLLYIKYDRTKLNILDAEKELLMLKDPIELETQYFTIWIDVCPSNGNLLASGGDDGLIKIFDKREAAIVKTFPETHSRSISCVRWNPSGNTLASSSDDCTAKVTDFTTGKIIYSGASVDKSECLSIEFY